MINGSGKTASPTMEVEPIVGEACLDKVGGDTVGGGT